MTGRTGRERAEVAAVRAVAALVYGLAALCVVLRGPRALMWFLPALLGAPVAVRCVVRGTRPPRRAVGDNRPSDYGAGGRRP